MGRRARGLAARHQFHKGKRSIRVTAGVDLPDRCDAPTCPRLNCVRRLESGGAFVVAKRWGVRRGASGSNRRDRPGLRGAWRAGCGAEVRIGKAYSTARQRRAGRTAMLVGIARAYRGRVSGVAVEVLDVSRRPPPLPLRSKGSGGGLRRSCGL